MATTTDKIQLEIELSNGKKAGQTLNELTGTAAKLTRELKQLKPGTEEFINKSKDLQAVNGRIKEIKTEMYGAKEAAKGLAGEFGQFVPFSGQFQQLRGAIGAISPALNTGTKAANIFKMAMIAIPIMAIITAITGLIQWFKRTEEGAQKLRIITAAAGQVFQSIMDIVSKLGKMIWDAFSSPKEAISGIGNAIKEFVLSRIELLMSGIKGIGTAFTLLMKGEFKAAAKEAGNSFIEINRAINPVAMVIEGQVKAVTALGKAAKNAYDEIKSDVQKAIALQERENKLKVDKRNFLAQEAKLEAEIAEAKLRGADQTLTAAEREKELGKAIELQKRLVDERTRLAAEEYLIQKEKNALSDTSEADMEKEAQLLADLIRLRKQGADQMKEVYSQQTGLQKQIQTEQENTRNKELAAEQALQDLKLELMDEGIDKTIAKINLEYEKKIAALQGNEAQIAEARALLEADQAEKIAEARRAKEEELRLEDEELQKQILLNKFEQAVITEAEFNESMYELKKTQIERELELIRESNGEESLEYARKYNDLLKLDNEYHGKKLSNEERYAKAKEEIEQFSLAASKEIFSIGFELLGQDEQMRKKNANALKAFSAGKVAIDYFEEVQAIWKNAEANATNMLFPGFASILAGVKTAAATARMAMALRSIQGQKFAIGGIIRGPAHSQGGIKMIDDAGRYYGEIEGDETILTGAVSRSPMGRMLASNLNAQFGGRRFALGGPINPLTPASQPSSVTSTMQAAPQVIADNRELVSEMRAMRMELNAYASQINQWPSMLKVGVSAGEIEDAMTVRAEVKKESEF